MGDDRYWRGWVEKTAQTSPCLSRKVGVMLVDEEGNYISSGINIPPVGYKICEGQCPRKQMGFKSGERLEYCPAVHAEQYAIAWAARNGFSTKGGCLYTSSIIPCRECAKLIVQAGIKEVVVADLTAYQQLGILGETILRAGGVKIRGYEDVDD